MPRVAFSLPRCDGVVGTQALCGVSEFLKIVGQNPRGDQHIHTRIEQVFFLQAVPVEHGQPGRVDLHQADVTRAVGVGGDDMCATAGLMPGNGF